MADLAPFVACVLKDKTVLELMRENERLRARISKAQRVQITGANGVPVYAQGQLDEDGKEFECHFYDKESFWQVDLTESDTACCDSIECLKQVELHIGESFRIVPTQNAPGEEVRVGYFTEYNVKTQKALVSFVETGISGGVTLCCSVGPMSKQEYRNINRRTQFDSFNVDDIEYVFENVFCDGVCVTFHFLQLSNSRWTGWNVTEGEREEEEEGKEGRSS